MNRMEFIRFALPHLIRSGTITNKETATLVQFVFDRGYFPEGEDDADHPLVTTHARVSRLYEKLQAGRRRGDGLAQAQRTP